MRRPARASARQASKTQANVVDKIALCLLAENLSSAGWETGNVASGGLPRPKGPCCGRHLVERSRPPPSAWTRPSPSGSASSSASYSRTSASRARKQFACLPNLRMSVSALLRKRLDEARLSGGSGMRTLGSALLGGVAACPGLSVRGLGLRAQPACMAGLVIALRGDRLSGEQIRKRFRCSGAPSVSWLCTRMSVSARAGRQGPTRRSPERPVAVCSGRAARTHERWARAPACCRSSVMAKHSPLRPSDARSAQVSRPTAPGSAAFLATCPAGSFVGWSGPAAPQEGGPPTF
jgi:hypothetical protein